jgi:hypothetical protein
MVESVQDWKSHTPLQVSLRQAGLSAAVERRMRRDTILQARQAETERRYAVRYALAALSAILPGIERDPCRSVGEQLQRRYDGLRQARRETEAVMRSEPDGSTPALAIRAPGAINGQEARYSRRWQSSSRAYLATLEDERGQLLDWQCYRVMPDGSRIMVETERKSAKSRSAKSAKSDRQARLRAAAGTIRMAEQD